MNVTTNISISDSYLCLFYNMFVSIFIACIEFAGVTLVLYLN